MEGKEYNYSGICINGFLGVLINLLSIVAGVYFLVGAGVAYNNNGLWFILGIILLAWSLLMFRGYKMLEPNEARVLLFFGRYAGTFKLTGFYWVNPLLTAKALSLRSRNLDAEPIKVNDKVGNPILIGMVLVWRLKDTYKAMFEIDAQTMASVGGITGGTVATRMLAFEKFVRIQSDAALRQVAGQYAYDNVEDIGKTGNGDDEMTLRDGGEEINEQLEQKLNERLAMAGIEVQEARLNYLTYAPEIAAVMLRRQQANAVIAAREKIVEGAVSMVQMALTELDNKDIVKLDEGQKAALVSNLLVVLCADESAQPVVSTGVNE